MGDEKICGEKVGEIDYAILVSLNYLRDSDIRSIDEEIRELSNMLQIRCIIIEKHFYQLVKNGSIISNMESGNESRNKYVLTQAGTDAMNEFERCNEEWMAIDSFIKTSIENKKERKLKIYKTTNNILTVAAIICILSIVYVAIFF